MKNFKIIFCFVTLFSCQPRSFNSSSNVAINSENKIKDYNSIPLASATVGLYATVQGVLDYGDGICSGSLIAPQIILTAAHCIETKVKDSKAKTQWATPGSDMRENLKAGTNSYYIKEWIKFPVQKPDETDSMGPPYDRNDLAIGILKTKVPTKSFMPFKGLEKIPAAGFKHSSVYGFGRKLFKDPSSGGYFGAIQNITLMFDDYKGMLVAPIDSKNRTCWGDSGGPALILEDNRYVQAGITTGTRVVDEDLTKDPCASQREDHFLILTMNHVDWINSEIKSHP